jgi:hypothetical protein
MHITDEHHDHVALQQPPETNTSRSTTPIPRRTATITMRPITLNPKVSLRILSPLIPSAPIVPASPTTTSLLERKAVTYTVPTSITTTKHKERWMILLYSLLTNTPTLTRRQGC